MARPDELRGRVALVTGAGGAAIGSTTCHVLAARGASIVAVDSHERRTRAVAEAVAADHGVPTLALPGDVADRAAMDDVVARATAELGSVDILVNSAAINVQGSIFDFDPDDWDRVLAVDLTACWYLIRRTIHGMRDRGWGRIVNISSVAAYNGGEGREGPYSAAKAALNDVTRAVAVEAGPYGIRCNAVAPGLVQSRWMDAHPGRYDRFLAATPLRRHAQPEDVANTVAFLCSDDSAHITGEVINVSGGWLLRP